MGSGVKKRKRYVLLNNKSSVLLTVNAGTPQGTLSGPNDFKLLINDLCFDDEYLKYVDDSTVVSESEDPNDDSLQNSSNYFIGWCTVTGMRPNPKKCKELLIYFGRKFSKDSVPVLMVGGEAVERVEKFKLLGVVFNSKLTWDDHIPYLLQKVSKRFYIIFKLARIGIPPHDIILVYIAIIRSVLEYACAVWHSGLTKSQSDDLERVQRRCLRIIFPDLSYSDALNIANIERLSIRRENIVRVLFEEIKRPGHVLGHLLTSKNVHDYNTRDTYPYEIPIARTKRFSSSFIPYCLFKRY